MNSPTQFVDATGMWPTVIHNLILSLAFPNLSAAQMASMQRGSYEVDVPWTMFAAFANEHAMRKVGQSVGDAKRGMNSFIDKNNAQAASTNTGGDDPTPESLEYFGTATHPITDNISPSHKDFQVYDDSKMWLCTLFAPFFCKEYWDAMDQHMQEEETITEDELNRAVTAARINYRKVYGENALRKATGIFNGSTLRFMDFILRGNERPDQIRVKNLGTVTVRANGSQHYEGPLTKLK